MSNTGYLRTMSDSNFNKRLLHEPDADVTGYFSYPFIGHTWMWSGPPSAPVARGTARPPRPARPHTWAATWCPGRAHGEPGGRQEK